MRVVKARSPARLLPETHKIDLISRLYRIKVGTWQSPTSVRPQTSTMFRPQTAPMVCRPGRGHLSHRSRSPEAGRPTGHRRRVRRFRPGHPPSCRIRPSAPGSSWRSPTSSRPGPSAGPPVATIELHDHGHLRRCGGRSQRALVETTVRAPPTGVALIEQPPRSAPASTGRSARATSTTCSNDGTEHAVSVHVYGPRLTTMSLLRAGRPGPPQRGPDRGGRAPGPLRHHQPRTTLREPVGRRVGGRGPHRTSTGSGPRSWTPWPLAGGLDRRHPPGGPAGRSKASCRGPWSSNAMCSSGGSIPTAATGCPT